MFLKMLSDIHILKLASPLPPQLLQNIKIRCYPKLKLKSECCGV